MCIDINRVFVTKRVIIGYKNVIPSARAGVFYSGVGPTSRSQQEGYRNVGHVLKYRTGKVTRSPSGPGIFVYRRYKDDSFAGSGIRIRVAIPAGSKVRVQYRDKRNLDVDPIVCAPRVRTLGIA